MVRWREGLQPCRSRAARGRSCTPKAKRTEWRASDPEAKASMCSQKQLRPLSSSGSWNCRPTPSKTDHRNQYEDHRSGTRGPCLLPSATTASSHLVRAHQGAASLGWRPVTSCQTVKQRMTRWCEGQQHCRSCSVRVQGTQASKPQQHWQGKKASIAQHLQAPSGSACWICLVHPSRTSQHHRDLNGHKDRCWNLQGMEPQLFNVEWT
mmetsp:Transcript_25358/g.58413  ORF Transcript_25358/g.58413 Transcript_25358/m.58413 type:complete len:208 (-) Transcript_25358:1054-1677(-)